MVLRDRAMEVSGVQSVRVRMTRGRVDVRAVSHFRELDDVRATWTTRSPTASGASGCPGRPPCRCVSSGPAGRGEDGCSGSSTAYCSVSSAWPCSSSAARYWPWASAGRWPTWWIHDDRHDVLLSDAERTRYRDAGWWWPTVLAVLAALVLLALWWLAAVLRRRRLTEVLVDTGDGEGALLRGRALENALAGEAARLEAWNGPT